MDELEALLEPVVELAPWLTLVSLLMAVASMLAVPWLVVRIPADYFVAPRHEHPTRGHKGWTIWLLRNIAGCLLIALGILMLVLPGQGILTILIGIAVSALPFKYRMERWLVARPRVMSALNWIRRRYDKPPLKTPWQDPTDSDPR